MGADRVWEERTDVTVVVLAGGRSTRFGRDKLAAPLGDGSVLDHLLQALPARWPLVLVGPRRATPRPDAVWTIEEPPGGGPLAAVAAGLAAADASALGGGPVAVVAGDMPLAASALPALLVALDEDPDLAAAVAADGAGRANPLLGVYRRQPLRDVLAGPVRDAPARRLLALSHRRVRIVGDAARDVDTPEDLRRLGTGPDPDRREAPPRGEA
ncbi:molybdenum cofactor guanylyltransferase [Phycicoccus sonneratiae]|uniref:NTP transferase domain-containing protein n=1 Tax=Phycicoccus sonneratiae TaxID=2807628 RepID=A0ABS2CQV4_9MICO|nr:NTP transferase domain-containing protein [Phycicoccus sonneraticus]MBM6402277.1 NTP transferase domain-containing protein [Phycicoccus sonneraticus]